MLFEEIEQAIKADVPHDVFPGGRMWIAANGTASQMSWGLTPSWAKDPNFGRLNCYNARSETVFEKPSFKYSIREHRCIVVAQSFFEQSDGRWFEFMHREDESLLMAGIFEPSNHHVDVPSFAVVTTIPTQQILPVNDRMPVLFLPEEASAWMSDSLTESDIKSLMKPAFEGELQIHDRGSNRKTSSQQETLPW